MNVKKNKKFIISFCNRMVCSHVHFRTFQKNILFSAFISVLCHRTFRSLHSFLFIAKERFVLCVHFRSIEKNILFSAFISVLCKRTFCSLRSFLFFAKESFVLCVHFRSLQKNVSFSAFISIICKRTFRSLRSFPFFRKERIVLLGFISVQKHEKRMYVKECFFL